MLKIEAVATIYYTYELTEKEEKEVRELIEKNEDDKYSYMTEAEQISTAFAELYYEGKTKLYQNSDTVESDFSTESFGYSEFNKCDAKTWLKGEKV